MYEQYIHVSDISTANISKVSCRENAKKSQPAKTNICFTTLEKTKKDLFKETILSIHLTTIETTVFV